MFAFYYTIPGEVMQLGIFLVRMGKNIVEKPFCEKSIDYILLIC